MLFKIKRVGWILSYLKWVGFVLSQNKDSYRLCVFLYAKQGFASGYFAFLRKLSMTFKIFSFVQSQYDKKINQYDKTRQYDKFISMTK